MARSASETQVSILPLTAGAVGGALAGASIGTLLGAMAGWTSVEGACLAGALAGLCALATLPVSLLMIGPSARARSRNFGLVVVTGGKLRSVASLLLALVLYFALKPDGKTFWTGFLASGLVLLMVETVWSMGVARRVCGPASVGVSRSSDMTGVAS